MPQNYEGEGASPHWLLLNEPQLLEWILYFKSIVFGLCCGARAWCQDRRLINLMSCEYWCYISRVFAELYFLLLYSLVCLYIICSYFDECTHSPLVDSGGGVITYILEIYWLHSL